MTEDLPSLQLITVKFQEPVIHQPSATFLDYFALYVLCTFDLPICRVAVRFSVHNGSVKFYYIDASGIASTYRLAHQSRVEKYAARRIPKVPFEVPRLGVLVTFKSIAKILYAYC